MERFSVPRELSLVTILFFHQGWQIATHRAHPRQRHPYRRFPGQTGTNKQQENQPPPGPPQPLSNGVSLGVIFDRHRDLAPWFALLGPPVERLE